MPDLKDPDGVPGSQTFRELREVTADPQKKRIFLDRLGDLRDQKWPKEKARNNYFRFKK